MINLGVLQQMISGKKPPMVDLYNENFSDTDEVENFNLCKIDGEVNLFNRLPTENSIEKFRQK